MSMPRRWTAAVGNAPLLPNPVSRTRPTYGRTDAPLSPAEREAPPTAVAGGAIVRGGRVPTHR